MDRPTPRFRRTPEKDAALQPTAETFPMRINKYLAHQKHCTRREADELIAAGKIRINGRQALLGDQVSETDKVEVFFRPRTYHYFAYNKPRGIVSHSPQEGERDIVEVAGIPGVFPVGRLDKDSSGLIILTDDGRIVERLLHPSFDHEKEYLVTVQEDLVESVKGRMERGVLIEGYITKPAQVHIRDAHTFSITITEGKKHQIRRMCAALGYTVNTLERVRVMNILLGSLPSCANRPIVGDELAELLRLLGFD